MKRKLIWLDLKHKFLHENSTFFLSRRYMIFPLLFMIMLKTVSKWVHLLHWKWWKFHNTELVQKIACLFRILKKKKLFKSIFIRSIHYMNPIIVKIHFILKWRVFFRVFSYKKKDPNTKDLNIFHFLLLFFLLSLSFNSCSRTNFYEEFIFGVQNTPYMWYFHYFYLDPVDHFSINKE